MTSEQLLSAFRRYCDVYKFDDFWTRGNTFCMESSGCWSAKIMLCGKLRLIPVSSTTRRITSAAEACCSAIYPSIMIISALFLTALSKPPPRRSGTAEIPARQTRIINLSPIGRREKINRLTRRSQKSGVSAIRLRNGSWELRTI
jgi:hypothetical protein